MIFKGTECEDNPKIKKQIVSILNKMNIIICAWGTGDKSDKGQNTHKHIKRYLTIIKKIDPKFHKINNLCVFNADAML